MMLSFLFSALLIQKAPFLERFTSWQVYIEVHRSCCGFRTGLLFSTDSSKLEGKIRFAVGVAV